MTARRSLLTLLAASLVAASLVGCVASAQSASRTETPTVSPTSTPVPVTAVAIGDSIAIGNGVPAEDAWPLLVADRLGWTLTDFGESAAGFTVKGLNTHTFDDQVSAAIRLRPDVVIIAATRNDLFASTTSLRAAATAALERLRSALPETRIIGVGAIWGSDVAPGQVALISSTVKTAVLAVGGSWIDVGQPFAGRPDLVQADRIHPTVEGQRLLASTISAAISRRLVTG